MYAPMLKNRVYGCHGNHAFFHGATEFVFEDKNYLHFEVPMNDLATTKIVLGVQSRSNKLPDYYV